MTSRVRLSLLIVGGHALMFILSLAGGAAQPLGRAGSTSSKGSSTTVLVMCFAPAPTNGGIAGVACNASSTSCSSRLDNCKKHNSAQGMVFLSTCASSNVKSFAGKYSCQTIACWTARNYRTRIYTTTPYEHLTAPVGREGRHCYYTATRTHRNYVIDMACDADAGAAFQKPSTFIHVATRGCQTTILLKHDAHNYKC